MIKNKKFKILTISILCILTMAIGLSYGYYLLNRAQENGNVAGSKCFNLEFTNEKNAISLDNMYPISDEKGKKLTPYSFTITNTCDMLAGYTVNMEMLEGTTLNSKYLDVMVNNEEIKLLSNYESTDMVISTSTESRILAKGTLAYNDSIDYTVRFWMDKDVEDVDSMNKYFASKIVVVATPSTWNPKDAGYDTLHDAILANEYQSSSEDAIKRIEAKETPDLTNTVPTIKWQGKIDNNTITKSFYKIAASEINTDEASSKLTTDDSLLKLYSSYQFAENDGIYKLNDFKYIDPTTIDYENDISYFIINENNQIDKDGNIVTSSGSNNRYIYRIVSANKSLSTITINNKNYNAVKYDLELLTYSSVELEVNNLYQGMYATSDNYGTSYYYRGNVKNNNVYFAGFYWQIIRINGDSSIRLIYNGKTSNATGDVKNIGSSSFNEKYDDFAYAGYMYGETGVDDYTMATTNTNDSTIKMIIDNWYVNNIENKNFSDYLTDSGFCGDRSLASTSQFSDNNISFSSYERNKTASQTLICPSNNDLYTTKNASDGNKALTYPVGLITYDELIYAGMTNQKINNYNFLSSSQHYWTMTPVSYSRQSNDVKIWDKDSSNIINYFWKSNGKLGVRPVINLKSDVKITGGIGTSNDPFVIDTN